MSTRFFIFGFLMLLIGVQLRMVDSFVLTPRASQFVERNMRQVSVRPDDPYDLNSVLLSAGPTPKRTITPPNWLGWAFLSVGGVLLLHAVTIQKLD